MRIKDKGDSNTEGSLMGKDKEEEKLGGVRMVNECIKEL